MSPKGPYPTRDVPVAVLGQVHVEYAGVSYTAEERASGVEVIGARLRPGNWAQIKGDTLTIRFGHRAADLLDKLVSPTESERVQIASLLIAAVCGHPRGAEPGEPIDFVWSDHIALVAGISLRTAFEISDVKTPQRYWLRNMEGRVRVTGVDDLNSGEL
jgi:hypothetical protein